MSESKTVNDLTEWNFKVALNFIEKAIENSDWDQAIAKCDQGIQGATDLKNNIWVHKFDNIKQEIIGLKEKEKNMDTIKHKVMIPRLEEKKEGIKMQGTEIIEKVLDAPEQEEMINDDLSIIKGVGSTTEQKLKEAGILSVKQLAGMNPRDLAQINGFGLSSSERIISAAKEYFDQQNESEESLQNKSSPKASMFDQKYSIDRTSRIIPPPKKTSNLSNDIREPPLEDILYSENLEELDDYEEELIEPELVNAKSPQ